MIDTTISPETIDSDFMAQAIRLARRGLGTTWPNPAVGAVLVRPDLDMRIVGRGSTGQDGTPHAETVALAEAGDLARGATLYVSLEPCSHYGRTPPCVDAIIAAGVARIVAAMTDPNPLVAGQGFARLRDAGVAVDVGLPEESARDQILGHIIRVTEGRPAITLKIAAGSDDLIPAGKGTPNFVTGEIARAHTHLLRARHDAILVGRGTIEADDPALTCRLPGMAPRSPVRIVLDSRAKLSPNARILSDPLASPVWVVCGESADPASIATLTDAGATVLPVGVSASGKPEISSVLDALSARGITTVLVEGGPRIWRAFLDAGAVDRVALYRGAAAAAEGSLKPFETEGLDRLTSDPHFSLFSTRRLGPDVLEWRVK